MSSRSEILERIHAGKPECIVELDSLNSDIFREGKKNVEVFESMVKTVSGEVFIIPSNVEALKKTQKLFPKVKKKYTTLKDHKYFNTIFSKNTHELKDLDLLVLEGGIGVAENGAIWISDEQITPRVLPFITKHLVLVIDEKKIVENMHDAYDKLKNLDYNYGVFISGPSKTADIEQSLVVGAQGALSLTVFIKKP